MLTTPTIPTITDPQLIDAALLEIQGKLETGLDWLDVAFGKSYRLQETVDGKKRFFPAVYYGGASGNEYLKLIPDSHIGNFCFFDVEEGEKSNRVARSYDQFVADLALIFWFDFRTVFPSPDNHVNRTLENVKAEVYRLLKEMRLTTCSIAFNQFFERKEEVYRGYWVPDMDNQFYMRPFGLFRLEGQIIYKENFTVCT